MKKFIFVLCFLMLLIPGVSAESREIGQLSDFDSTSAEVESREDRYHTGPYSMAFLKTPWAHEALDPFQTCSVKLNYRFDGDHDIMYILIGEQGSSVNLITVKVYIPVDNKHKTHVDVYDKFGDDVKSGGDEVVLDSFQNDNTEWNRIEIGIAETEKITDGSAKKITVAIDDNEIIDDMELLSSEGSADPLERTFYFVRFTGNDNNDDRFYLDDITITTNADETTFDIVRDAVPFTDKPVNFTWVVVGSSIALVGIAVFLMKPLKYIGWPPGRTTK